MKGKNLQPRIFYPARVSFTLSKQNQKLYREAKTKRIKQHQTSFTTTAKGTSIGKKHKRTNEKGKEKDLQKQIQNN